MKIAGKLGAIVALIVVGFFVIVGLLVAGMATAATLNDLQLQTAEVTTSAYRLSTHTGNLLVATTPLPTLFRMWREAQRQLDSSIERLSTHRGAAILGEDVGASISRTVQFWRMADPRVAAAEESIAAVLAMDQIPPAAKTGLAPTIRFLLAQDEIQYDVVLSLNSAQSAVSMIGETIMTILVRNAEEIAQGVRAGVVQFQRRVMTIVVAASVAVLVISFVLALLFTRRLARRIRSMESVMRRVAERDISARTEDRSRDEIGGLSRHLNEVMDTLSSFFADTRRAIDQVNELKDTMAASSNQSAAALNEISKNIESIKDQFKTLDRDITGSGEAVEIIVGEMANLARGIEQQVGAVNQSSSSIEQMNASIQSVARVATERKERADQLRQVVQEGGENIGATNEVVRSITSEIDEILEIIGVINGISSQTNLLSMNAAIESAHAGEAGRGFAVVAEEIRKLSESTAENAKRIGSSLKSMTEQIRHALQTSDAGYESYEAISRDVDEFAQAMAEIAASMQELTSAGGEVLHASEEVHRVTGEIREGSVVMNQRTGEIRAAVTSLSDISSHVVQGMDEIDSGTREILSAMVAVSDATNESKQRMEQLSRMIDTFTVSAAEIPATDRDAEATDRAAEESGVTELATAAPVE